ncbi:MAG: MBL fold metallo-hydrolase [Clostridiales bacterium]|jgi:L-ascorbate metabolism protein UlaG (beta-lactamase superfamily)|nr:MBL fold metallo-hydrolase [Clostridiales bacterium]
MKITYIYHSGFIVETETAVFIFDYYKEAALVEDYLRSADAGKDVFFFASHSHFDHFNPEIFEFSKVRPAAFILSSEIRSSCGNREGVVFLDKLESYDLPGGGRAEAFGSTDAGASFLVWRDGLKIFHAGDLNNWHWNEQAPPKEAAAMGRLFLSEAALIKEASGGSVDLAMFPVDSRLGRDYALGAEQFLQEVKTRVFAPMHSWDDYKAANAFKAEAEKYAEVFFEIRGVGESGRF